ncbi:MAG: glutamate synthase subunit beta [Mariprofundales bacterium]
MGKPTGFKEYERQELAYAPIIERVQHYNEFSVLPDNDDMQSQGARCMDCGIPFCHNGCPVNNIIPDWNDLVYRNQWRKALDVLHSTNNFPEFTGRLCPAPCEEACTLNINLPPVSIKNIERGIIDKAWQEGWITPQVPKCRTGKRVAIIGSGPAGMACAQQLARAGHEVVLFEKNARIGGLLRYGIPDFKLEKSVIDRRMTQMRAEGVEFRTHTHVGSDKFPVKKLLDKFDAIGLTGGSEQGRNLHESIAGRDLDGVYFAMHFLAQQNRRVSGEIIRKSEVRAEGKHVIVIGGGDTGSDCIGTSTRQGAELITQLELLPKPPAEADKANTWPYWPRKERISTSQTEADLEPLYATETLEILGNDAGDVQAVKCIKVKWEVDNAGRWQKTRLAGTEFELKADLVLLAMGFENPIYAGMLASLDIKLDARKNVQATTSGEQAYKTSIDKVFAAGDMRRGQSLVVWAICEGRQCARSIDTFLMGNSELPE